MTSSFKMAASIPPLPAGFKQLQHYLKTGQEHEQKYPVISYYCRMYVLQKGMEIDKSSPEAKAFLLYMMEQLENMKMALGEEEAIKSDTVAQAHVENYALKLFAHADTEDRAARHNKNVIKAFYNSSLLFEVLTVFGPLSEDIEKYKKYARYKSAYINRCMKAGITPVPGPEDEEGQDLGMGDLSVSDYMASRAGGASGYSADSAAGYNQPDVYGGGGGGGYHQPPTTHQPPPSHPPTQSYSQPPPVSSGDFEVNWEKAMKNTKFAVSSITYEDKEAAIEYLQKAINLLSTGHE